MINSDVVKNVLAQSLFRLKERSVTSYLVVYLEQNPISHLIFIHCHFSLENLNSDCRFSYCVLLYYLYNIRQVRVISDHVIRIIWI